MNTTTTSFSSAADLALAYEQGGALRAGITSTLRSMYGDAAYLTAFADAVMEIRGRNLSSAKFGDLATALKRAAPEGGQRLTFKFKKVKGIVKAADRMTVAVVPAAEAVKKSEMDKAIAAIKVLYGVGYGSPEALAQLAEVCSVFRGLTEDSSALGNLGDLRMACNERAKELLEAAGE